MNNNLFATPQVVGQVEMSFDDPAAGVLITPRLAAYTARPDMEALMDELWRDPVAFCSAHGRDRGYCCFCCAPLSTIESRERGYGPVCASHHGLPWGG